MDGYQFNKIAGGVLAAALLIFGGRTLSAIALHEPKAEKPGYVIPVKAVAAAPGAAAAGFSPKDVIEGLKKAAASNVEAGKDVFKKCAACHTVDKGGENKAPARTSMASSAARSAATRASPTPTPSRTRAAIGPWRRWSPTCTIPRPPSPATRWPSPASRIPSDLADVLAYLRTLERQPGAAAELSGTKPTHSTASASLAEAVFISIDPVFRLPRFRVAYEQHVTWKCLRAGPFSGAVSLRRGISLTLGASTR